MSEPNEFERQTSARRISVTLVGYVLVLMLLVEIAVPLTYFGVMPLVILIGPGNLEPPKLIAIGIHIIAATLYFLSFWGVGFCFFGVILRKSLVKWLLITLSIVGVLLLPIAICEEPDGSFLLHLAYHLAGWSVLILISTLSAFHYMESRPRRALKKCRESSFEML
jgi:hypothetical protein